MFKVKVDVSDLARAFGDAKEHFLNGLESGLNEAALEVEKAAKGKVPYNTGELQQSIRSEVEVSGMSGTATVYTNNQYAIYVHEGTGIYARHGDGRKEVPWPYTDDKTGEKIWTKGTHSTPFMEDAVNEKRDLVGQIVRKEIMKRLGG